jgi:hypothetical protein
MGFIADVFDCVIIDNTTGEAVGSTTLSSANITVDVQENEIRSGRGNTLQGVLHSARDITVEAEDTHFKYDWLARKVGQSITTGAGVGYATPKNYTVSGSSTITLDNAPLTGVSDPIVIYDTTTNTLLTKVASAPAAGQFSVSGTTVTFNSGLNNKIVEVRTYKYNTSASTQTINIDTTTFAKGCALVLETIEIDENEVPKFKVQWQFPVALPNGSFSLNTASERNASAQNTSFRIAKPANSNVVGTVLRIPI